MVPSITMRSDCRREPIGRTPNLSRSCRAPLAAPNSALQQAVVILTGQREYIRAQLTTFRIGPVSTTFLTRSLSLPTQMLSPSASVATGSSSCHLLPVCNFLGYCPSLVDDFRLSQYLSHVCLGEATELHETDQVEGGFSVERFFGSTD